MITWACEICGWQIVDGAGWVYLSSGDYRTVGRPRAEQKKWHTQHTVCLDESERSAAGYDLEVHTLRTWTGLARWTAHLARKVWIASTNWGELVCERACGAERLGMIDALKPREREAWGRVEDIGYYLKTFSDDIKGDDSTLIGWANGTQRFLAASRTDA